MTSSSWVAKAAVAGLAALTAALALVGGAAGEPVNGVAEATSPRTWFVKLDEPSTSTAFRQNRDDGLRAARAAARLQKRDVADTQSEVIDSLPDGAEPVYRTHAVLAGIAVTAGSQDKARIESIDGVAAVYPVAPKFPDNAYAVPFQSGAVAWQDTGFLGQGQTIAVIDTGVDYTHAAFGGPGTVLAYEQAHQNEGSAPDPLVFPNGKVIGGIDLVGDDYNATSGDPAYQPDAQPDPNPIDCGGHGSHVAGSAAGYGVNADGSTYGGPYDGTTNFGALKIGPGMAPEADIYAIKVFGCAGSTEFVTEAIDHAVDPNGDGDPSDRVDVINLSLGSDFGSVQDADSVAANAAVSMGVSVVASAGNSGDVTDISGSPGDASRVLSVASSVDAESKVDGAEVTIDGNQETYGMIRSVRYDWENSPDLSGPVVAAPAENETACAPYDGTPFTGKVVLVRWNDASPECGSITRGDNLAAAGAAGFIFGSNSEAFSAGINGDDVIPGVLIVASGADAIRDALAADLEVTVDGTVVNGVTQNFPADNDKISSFSSRGAHAAGNVKPDVTAVGNSVFSVDVGAGSGGTGLSGTSMASPMVAGLAALVRQANPAWTPLQVKAAIMNTATHDLFVNGSADPGSGMYGPPRVGAGRIDSAQATSGEVLAYDPSNGAVSASFGPVEVTAPLNLGREITVENESASPVTYDIAYDPINEVPGAVINVTPGQISVDPGESVSATVSLEVTDPSALTKAVDPTVGRLAPSGYPRETLAESFGRILLDDTGPGPTLRVPVYASPRPASQMTQPQSLKVHRTAATSAGPDQVKDFELSGTGTGSGNGENGVGDGDPDNDIESIAAGFELQAVSDLAPDCGGSVQTACRRLAEERYADLKMVGYTSNTPYVSDPAAQRAYFAVAVHGPAAIPASKAVIQFDLDVDGDGEPDLMLYNDRRGEEDVFVSELYDPSKPAGERVVSQLALNGRLGNLDTALYDSDVMMLPVSLQVLAGYGVDPGNPRIDYGVEGYSYFTDEPIDVISVDPGTGSLVDPLTADLYEPGIVVTDESGSGPLVADQPGEQLTLTRNIASWEADSGLGAMMLHFHNPVGEKAQRIDLEAADSSTDLFVSPGSLSARVDAVGGGLPAPSGEVSFSVDGSVVGSAPIESGIATLEHDVAHGATREVEARYLGDADFEPSSDMVTRTDPGLTAKVSSAGAKNRFGWYRKPVTVSFRCVRGTADLTEDCPYPRRLAGDGRSQKVTRTIVAFDGGRASVTVKGISIDRTPPVVRLKGLRRGATYPRVRQAVCVARDRTSGVLRCVTGWTRRGRVVTYSATATDRAGNRKVLRFRTRLSR